MQDPRVADDKGEGDTLDPEASFFDAADRLIHATNAESLDEALDLVDELDASLGPLPGQDNAFAVLAERIGQETALARLQQSAMADIAAQDLFRAFGALESRGPIQDAGLPSGIVERYGTAWLAALPMRSH